MMAIPVIVFLGLVFIIGLFAAQRIEGQVRNYFIAGKSLPLWIASLSLTAQSLDANATLGNATFSYQSGFWAGAVLPLGLAMSLLLTGRFFAEPLNKMDLLTLPDFYFRRYNRPVEFITSVLTVLSFLVLLAGNLAGVGILGQYIFGIPYPISLIGMAFIIFLYTVLGGLISVAWTDVFQITIVIVGCLMGFFWLTTILGLSTLVNTIGTIHFAPVYDINEGALPTWAALLALGLGDIVALDFMERVFAAKTPKIARISCYIAGVMTIIVGTSISLMGLMARVFYTASTDTAIFLKFTVEQLPFAIGVMIIVGIIGASMSTADGAILATSTVITRNILQSNFSSRMSDYSLLKYSRLFAIPITILAVVFAIIRPDPGILLVVAFDIVFAGLFFPLVFGIYWKKGSSSAAFVSIIVASIARLILYFQIPEKYIGLDTLIPPVISLVLFVGISIVIDSGILVSLTEAKKEIR